MKEDDLKKIITVLVRGVGNLQSNNAAPWDAKVDEDGCVVRIEDWAGSLVCDIDCEDTGEENLVLADGICDAVNIACSVADTLSGELSEKKLREALLAIEREEDEGQRAD